jgi:hypothetical protein
LETIRAGDQSCPLLFHKNGTKIDPTKKEQEGTKYWSFSRVCLSYADFNVRRKLRNLENANTQPHPTHSPNALNAKSVIPKVKEFNEK